MTTIFHIKSEEMTGTFLKTLKSLYNGKVLNITIEPEMDETEYLIASEANRKALEKALKSKEGYVFSSSEFQKFTRDLLNGKKTDRSKLKKVKITA